MNLGVNLFKLLIVANIVSIDSLKLMFGVMVVTIDFVDLGLVIGGELDDRVFFTDGGFN